MTQMTKSITWTDQQSDALRRARQWLSSPGRPYFMLAGYAGTGKTTLATTLAERVVNVHFAAYTGKAAHVLRKAGAPNPTTLHSLIYLPQEKCDEYFRELKRDRAALLRRDPVPTKDVAKLDVLIKRERKNLSHPDFVINPQSPLWDADLLVIDEYSMVDEDMGADLLSFNCPILALGDPGQLPPVNGEGRCFFKGEPDAMLTSIVRQGANNPIIQMSMDVREGRRLSQGQYGDSRVCNVRDLSDEQMGEILKASDQFLVGTNVTRRKFNRYYREVMGLRKRQDFERKTRRYDTVVAEADLPVDGDLVVCRRNNRKECLYNGQPWKVLSASKAHGGLLKLKLVDENGRVFMTLSHPHHFLGVENKIDPHSRRDANEFDYSYALTVHRSQGSQWDHVVLYDEWRVPQSRRQWLYTGITRAAETITVVQI